MKAVKFIAQIELDIELKDANTYTRLSGYVEDNNLVILSPEGKIIDFSIKKLERKDNGNEKR